MIHGMWCGGWVWSNQVKFLQKKGLTCSCPDLRFHGECFKNPNPNLGRVSLLDYLKDLEEKILLFKRDFGDWPIGMGHSMGGLLGQILASRGLLKALILLAPAAPRGVVSTEKTVLDFFLPMLLKEGLKFRKRPLKPSFENAMRFLLNRVSREEQGAIYKKLGYESGRAVFEIGFWQLEWFRRAAKVKFKNVKCPIFIAAGGADEVTPALVVKKNMEKYRKKSPAILTYKEYPECAHWLLSEPEWEIIMKDVWSWLENLTNP